MSTSKKPSSKSIKSPAPTTKSAAAKPVEQKKTKVVASAAAAAPALKPAPVKSESTLKSVASRTIVTTINARVDVGFGNSLSIRGEGAGLSWDLGLPMDCVEDNLWRITLPESVRGHTYKFLVNDLTWSTGPDFTVASGSNVTHTPEF